MKTICYIGPTVPDGMFTMIRDGFRCLDEHWGSNVISLHADRTEPGFYRRCKRADLVLIGTNQGTNWRMIRDIAKVHNRWAVVDGSDYRDFTGIKVINPADAPLIFKREYVPEMHDQLGNIRPLSFSVLSSWRRPGRIPKFINFSFAGAWHQRRATFLRHVGENLRDPHSILSPGGLSPREYWSLLDSSKIAISLRGAGWDCVRTWEILSRRNTLLMLESFGKVKMTNPPLVDGMHCAMFSNPRELVEKLNHYARNEDARKRVAKAGRIFAFQHHSTFVRAKYILRTCLEHFRKHPS